MTRSTRSAARRSDDGQILVIAMVLVLIFATLAATIAVFASTSIRASRATARQTDVRSAAQAGARYVSERYQTGSTGEFGNCDGALRDLPTAMRTNGATLLKGSCQVIQPSQPTTTWSVLVNH